MNKSALFQKLCSAKPSDLVAALARLIGSGKIAVSQAAVVYHQVSACRRREGLRW